ncbi:MAG: hypothetical protein ACOY4I_11415 [Bacillota bacterium]
MRRNYYHDYKLLEGILGWYFGEAVALSYSCRPEAEPPFPAVLANGEVIARGRINADMIVKSLEDMGVERIEG